jgi:hypothetical protein
MEIATILLNPAGVFAWPPPQAISVPVAANVVNAGQQLNATSTACNRVFISLLCVSQPIPERGTVIPSAIQKKGGETLPVFA